MTPLPDFLHELAPVVPPWNGYFKQRKIPQVVLAKWCGVTPGWMSKLMAGHAPIPAHIERRLQDLKDRLEQGVGHGDL